LRIADFCLLVFAACLSVLHAFCCSRVQRNTNRSSSSASHGPSENHATSGSNSQESQSKNDSQSVGDATVPAVSMEHAPRRNVSHTTAAVTASVSLAASSEESSDGQHAKEDAAAAATQPDSGDNADTATGGSSNPPNVVRPLIDNGHEGGYGYR
jgi:cytoskeletal protein RodZ